MKRKTKTKQKAAAEAAAIVTQTNVAPSTVIPAEVNENTVADIKGAVTTNQILPQATPEPKEDEPRGPVIEICKVRFDFPDHELVGLGRQMVRCSRQIEALQNELASIKKDYASRVEKVEVERSRISQILDDGYEMRDVECVVLLYVDRQARTTEKVFYEKLTGKFVRREKVAGGVELDFFTLVPAGHQVESPLAENFLRDVL